MSRLLVWQKIAEKDSIEKGKGIEIKVGLKRIAIFNQDGYHGIDALCVHQDGSIAPGKLNGCVALNLQKNRPGILGFL